MKREPPILADLVFLGGGHAQIAAIKSFAMNPVPGLRLTIVTANIRTPYSGMLPAYVEGVWDDDDLHIDLAHLAQFSGARLIVAPCSGIDADGHKFNRMQPGRRPRPLSIEAPLDRLRPSAAAATPV